MKTNSRRRVKTDRMIEGNWSCYSSVSFPSKRRLTNVSWSVFFEVNTISEICLFRWSSKSRDDVTQEHVSAWLAFEVLLREYSNREVLSFRRQVVDWKRLFSQSSFFEPKLSWAVLSSVKGSSRDFSISWSQTQSKHRKGIFRSLSWFLNLFGYRGRVCLSFCSSNRRSQEEGLEEYLRGEYTPRWDSTSVRSCVWITDSSP